MWAGRTSPGPAGRACVVWPATAPVSDAVADHRPEAEAVPEMCGLGHRLVIATRQKVRVCGKTAPQAGLPVSLHPRHVGAAK